MANKNFKIVLCENRSQQQVDGEQCGLQGKQRPFEGSKDIEKGGEKDGQISCRNKKKQEYIKNFTGVKCTGQPKVNDQWAPKYYNGKSLIYVMAIT